MLLGLVLALLQGAVPQKAPVMQPPPGSEHWRMQLEKLNGRTADHESLLRNEQEKAEAAARYQAALHRNSRGGKAAAALAAKQAKEARPVSVVATLMDGCMLASWHLASTDRDSQESLLALSVVRMGISGSSGAGQQQYALPSDVLRLVVTSLRPEHTYTIEVNGEEVACQQQAAALKEGLAIGPAHFEHVKHNSWAVGTVGAETYYFRRAEPEKIFWKLPEGEGEGEGEWPPELRDESLGKDFAAGSQHIDAADVTFADPRGKEEL